MLASSRFFIRNRSKKCAQIDTVVQICAYLLKFTVSWSKVSTSWLKIEFRRNERHEQKMNGHERHDQCASTLHTRIRWRDVECVYFPTRSYQYARRMPTMILSLSLCLCMCPCQLASSRYLCCIVSEHENQSNATYAIWYCGTHGIGDFWYLPICPNAKAAHCGL